MRAMILAAGEGQRLRPLTLTTPKPLLPLGATTLIGQHLQRLAAAGFTQVVINTAYLGENIQQALGDGRRYGVSITYSPEAAPLETAGALLQALPLLGEAPFLLINGDILTDYPLQHLRRPLQGLGHLVLVNNPAHHPQGDFSLSPQGQLQASDTGSGLTFSGLSLLHPQLIHRYPHKRTAFPLREVFQWALNQHALSGEHYTGHWLDVGTPERYAQAQQWWADVGHNTP